MSNFFISKSKISFVLVFLFTLALIGTVRADGTFDDDNVIENEYGATRAIDGAGNDAANLDSESCAIPDGNRGNLMELHAYNTPVADEWYFAFVTDSSQALNSTSGNFFGKNDSTLVNYILGIDVGCDGGLGGDMNGGTPWRRFFSWQGATFSGGNAGVDYFMPMYPTGADTMNAQLYSMNGATKTQLVTDFPVTSRVVDFRRHFEIRLDSGLAGMPADLVGNDQLCLVMVTTESDDGTPGDGGKVLDTLGSGSAVTGCDLNYRFDGVGGNGPMPEKIDTLQNCQDSGRPMPGGSATRQCTSLPARQTVLAIDSGNICGGAPIGVSMEGDIEGTYVLLTESDYAGPYSGGSSTHSDFNGESSAFNYWDGSAMQTYGGNADVQDIAVQNDNYFLYLSVSGPGLTAFGGAGQMAGQPVDDSNLFVAIDVPSIDSDTDRGDHGGTPEAYTPPDAAAGADIGSHPGSRPINFRGWDPDYIVEMVWAGDDDTVGNVQLWKWNGAAWTVIETFTTVETAAASPSGVVPFDTSFHANANPPATGDLYFARQPTSYEFAIPWTSIGLTPTDPHPASGQNISLSAYTTHNDDGWDINDQAPGIGQGANGLGSHERIGDLPDENDNEADAAATGNDLTPFVGRTHGQAGRGPGSDNTAGDSDTLEAYFSFQVDPDTIECFPTAVQLQGEHIVAETNVVLPFVMTAILLITIGALSWHRRQAVL